MTPEQKFREVGTWLWLAGFSIEEAEGRIGKMNRAELRTAVRAGFVECAAAWAFMPAKAASTSTMATSCAAPVGR